VDWRPSKLVICLRTGLDFFFSHPSGWDFLR
jgi:hypothetical protein